MPLVFFIVKESLYFFVEFTTLKGSCSNILTLIGNNVKLKIPKKLIIADISSGSREC